MDIAGRCRLHTTEKRGGAFTAEAGAVEEEYLNQMVRRTLSWMGLPFGTWS